MDELKLIQSRNKADSTPYKSPVPSGNARFAPFNLAKSGVTESGIARLNRLALRPNLPSVLFWGTLALSWLSLFVDPTIGEELETATAPLVCSGWISPQRGFGLVGVSGPLTSEDFCPTGTAFMATMTPFHKRRPGSRIPIAGTCCPLPDGALLEEHTFSGDYCPPGHVATGARQHLDSLGVPEDSISAASSKHWVNRRLQELRCTKLNPVLFMLGASEPGIKVGWPKSFRTMYDHSTSRQQIPIALRVGFGRLEQYAWGEDFCAGTSFGTVLTGKSTKYCDGLRFNKLLPHPALNERERLRLTKLLAFDSCITIDSMYSSHPVCTLVRMTPAEKPRPSVKE